MKSRESVHLGGRINELPENIDLLKSDWNYTTIFFKDGSKSMVATTIGLIEKRLPKKQFFRVNRSTVVNLEKVHIAEDYSCVKNKHVGSIPISRRRRTEFQKLMED